MSNPNPTPETWTGTTAAKCMVPTCRRLFSTVSNFDRHRGPRGCVDPATLTHTRKDGTTVRVLKPVERSYGIVWVSWSEDPRWTDEGAA